MVRKETSLCREGTRGLPSRKSDGRQEEGVRSVKNLFCKVIHLDLPPETWSGSERCRRNEGFVWRSRMVVGRRGNRQPHLGENDLYLSEPKE